MDPRRRVDALIKQLRSRDTNSRVLAARALGQAGYPPGLEPLIQATKDKDPRVRRAAVRGLTRFTDDKAQVALRAEHLDSHHEKDQQGFQRHLAVAHAPGADPEHRGGADRESGVGDAAAQRVGR